MSFSKIMALWALLIVSKTVIGQNENAGLFLRSHKSDRMISLAKAGINITIDNFKDLKTSLDIGKDDVFTETGNQKSRSGLTHKKTLQTVDGLPVEDAVLIFHLKENIIQTINGYFLQHSENLRRSGVFIGTADAAEKVKRFLISEKRLVTEKITVEPVMKLLWTSLKRKSSWQASDYVLAYRADVTTSMHNYVVYVNASDGNIFKYFDETPADCSTTGSVGSMYNGNHTMYVTKTSPTNYKLDNTCNVANYKVRNSNRDTSSSPLLTDITSSNNTWTSNIQRIGGQVYYGVQRIDDYFRTKHLRPGYDLANAALDVRVNAAFRRDSSGILVAYGLNAVSPKNNTLHFGYGRTVESVTDDVINVGVVTHEYTHKVTWKTADLKYYSQSGALNEAFSDCFSELEESDETGAAPDWKVEFSPGDLLRSFSDPAAGNQPKFYRGDLWYSTDTCSSDVWNNDHCFVHHNSGVMNHWLYLLCTGTSPGYLNENGRHIDVSPISTSAASYILYETLSQYLTVTSDFLDCRNATVQAAEDLYGSCSNEAIQCAKAWFAVGADVESNFYDRQSGCINYVSNTVPYFNGGINSYNLNPGLFCGSLTETATNNPIIFGAGQYIKVYPGVTLKSTGTKPLVLQIGDCDYTNY